MHRPDQTVGTIAGLSSRARAANVPVITVQQQGCGDALPGLAPRNGEPVVTKTCAAAPAGSPCRTGKGKVAIQYHTARFRLMPQLAKVLSVPTPAVRNPGSVWTELPRPVSADAAIKYWRPLGSPRRYPYGADGNLLSHTELVETPPGHSPPQPLSAPTHDRIDRKVILEY